MQLHLLSANKLTLLAAYASFCVWVLGAPVLGGLKNAQFASLLSGVFAGANPATFPARPAAWHQQSVVSVKRVPALAMRFGSVDSRRSLTAQQVFLAGYRLKVVRVKAWPIAAQVIQLQALRNRAAYQFIHDSVGQLIFAVYSHDRIALHGLTKGPAFVWLANVGKQSEQAAVFSHLAS
jgi:hypothetical protein